MDVMAPSSSAFVSVSGSLPLPPPARPSTTTTTSSHRHVCSFAGCGKSFIRKEHLTRHALSHSTTSAYTCPVCQRGFARNDVLQRHVSRHNAAVDPAERNKRACQGCHKSKTRCAGGLPCANCARKGIECKFEASDAPLSAAPTVGSLSGASTDEHGGSQRGSRSQTPPSFNGNGEGGMPVGDGDAEPMIEDSFNYLEIRAHAIPEQHSQLIPDFDGDVDLLPENMGLDENRDSTSSDEATTPSTAFTLSLEIGNVIPGFDKNGIPTPLFIAPENSGFLERTHARPVDKHSGELYFIHFHPRWPVFHAASFDEDESVCLSSSMLMIGKWLERTEESRQTAIDIHSRLMDHLFPKLYQPAKFGESNDLWPIKEYQASLLNIIFGFYVGKNEILSRAIVMLSMLVGVMREVGLFRPETAMPKMKPDAFSPWKLVKTEERKRLAVLLFKIDSYIAILRNQSPLLRPEEMHFSLTTTFALWSSKGLHKFKALTDGEPAEREEMSIFDLTRQTPDSNPITPSILLPEDIQLSLLSLQSRIWTFCSTATGPDPALLPNHSALVSTLEFWKCKLDTVNIQPVPQAQALIPHGVIPERFYFGLEDHAKPGWHDVVLARPHTLIFDSTLLYHVLCLYLHANIRDLGLLFESTVSGPLDAVRKNSVYAWTATKSSRVAVFHVNMILKALQRRTTVDCNACIGTTDPIAYLAVYIACLVLWGFENYNVFGTCDQVTCAGAPFPDVDWKWVQEGGCSSIAAVPLCPCVLHVLISRFMVFLPGGKDANGGEKDGWTGLVRGLMGGK